MPLCENHISLLAERHDTGGDTQETLVTATVCPALATWGVWIAGVSNAGQGFLFVRHQPAVWQALACLDGCGEVWTPNGWQTCSTGQVYLTPPHIPHAYHPQPGTRWHVCWVISYTVTPAPGVVAPQLVSRSGASLYHAIQGLAADVDAGEGASSSYWARLIHDCARRFWTPRVNETEADDARLRAIWDAVERNLACPWDLPSLAARAGVSVEHLRRLSLRSVGVSPLRHVTRLRMRSAAALLETGAYTVSSVAMQVGYDNPFAFSVAFKREWGVSPSEWRVSRGNSPQR